MAGPKGFKGPDLEGGVPVIKSTSANGVANEVIGTVRENMELNDEWYDMGDGEFDPGIYRRWMGGMTERYQQEGLRLAVSRANPDNKAELMAMRIPLKAKPMAPSQAPKVADGDPADPKVALDKLDEGGGGGKGEPISDSATLAQALGALEIPEMPEADVTAITREIDHHQNWITELGAGPDGQLDFGSRAKLLGQVTLRAASKGFVTGLVSGGTSFAVDKVSKKAMKHFKGAPHLGSIVGGAMTTYSYFGNGGAGAKKKWAAITDGASKVFNEENWSKRPLATTADLFHWIGDMVGTVGDICSMLSMAFYIIAGLGFLLSLIPGLQPIAAIVSPCVNAGRITNKISGLCGPVARVANTMATAFRFAAILCEASDPTEMSEQLAIYEGEATGLVTSVTSSVTKKRLDQAYPDKPVVPTHTGGEPPEQQGKDESFGKTVKNELWKTVGITWDEGNPDKPWYDCMFSKERAELSQAWSERQAVKARIDSMYAEIDQAELEKRKSQMDGTDQLANYQADHDENVRQNKANQDKYDADYDASFLDPNKAGPQGQRPADLGDLDTNNLDNMRQHNVGGGYDSVENWQRLREVGRTRINEGLSQVGQLYGDAYQRSSIDALADEKAREKYREKGQTEIYTADLKLDDVDGGAASFPKRQADRQAQQNQWDSDYDRAEQNGWNGAPTGPRPEDVNRNTAAENYGATNQSSLDAAKNMENARISRAIVSPYTTARELTPGQGDYNLGLKKPATKAMASASEADKSTETPSQKAARELEEFLGRSVPKTDKELQEAADDRSGATKVFHSLADKGLVGSASAQAGELFDMGFNKLSEYTDSRWVPSETNMKFMAAKLPAPPEKNPWDPIGKLQEEIADRDASMGIMVKALDTNDKNAADSVVSQKDVAALEDNAKQAMDKNNENFKKQVVDKQEKVKEGETKATETTAQQKSGPTAQMGSQMGLVRGILSVIKGGVDAVNKVPGLNTSSTSKNIGGMIKGIDAFKDGETSTAGNKAKQDGEMSKNKEGLSKADAKTEKLTQQASDYKSLLLDKLNNEKEYQSYLNQDSAELLTKFSQTRAERETKFMEWSEKKTALKTWAMDHFQKRVEAGYGDDLLAPPNKEKATQDNTEERTANANGLAELRGHPGYARAQLRMMNRA